MKPSLKRYAISTADGREFFVEAEEVEMDGEGHLIFKSDRAFVSMFNARLWDSVKVVSEIVQRGKPFVATEEHKPVTLSADAEEEEGWT